LHLGPGQVQAFSIYAEELLRWNRRMNLTGLQEEADVVVKHFVASLAFTVAFPRGVSHRLADIGTGAGFPGIPMKIALPLLQVILVEASRKKISFLRHICTSLHLEGIRPVRMRAEDLAADAAYCEQFDLCVARAVGRRELLVRVAEALLRPGGCLILSGREKEEDPLPESNFLFFREARTVRIPSLGLVRSILVWEKREAQGRARVRGAPSELLWGE